VNDGDQGWHLKREVTLSQIVAIIVVAGSLIGLWGTFDRRVTRLEVTLEQSNSLLQEMRKDIKEVNAALNELLRRKE
jgi:uncharacterized protein YoxC